LRPYLDVAGEALLRRELMSKPLVGGGWWLWLERVIPPPIGAFAGWSGARWDCGWGCGRWAGQ
jgi:hypothetical protein